MPVDASPVAEVLAQPVHSGLDHVPATPGLAGVPDLVQQFAPPDHVADVAGEGGQEPQFDVAEPEHPPVEGGDPLCRVDAQRPVRELVVFTASAAGAAHDRGRPQREFARRERFRHVVVGAREQPGEPVSLLALGGEQDDRDVRRGTNPLAQLHPGRARQHHVEHDEVEGDDADHLRLVVDDEDAGS